MEHDLALLREVGANFVRGAHYPQDQRFLDLCDEAGIGVWEETLGPATSVESLTNPDFLRAQVGASPRAQMRIEPQCPGLQVL